MKHPTNYHERFEDVTKPDAEAQEPQSPYVSSEEVAESLRQRCRRCSKGPETCERFLGCWRSEIDKLEFRAAARALLPKPDAQEPQPPQAATLTDSIEDTIAAINDIVGLMVQMREEIK